MDVTPAANWIPETLPAKSQRRILNNLTIGEIQWGQIQGEIYELGTHWRRREFQVC